MNLSEQCVSLELAQRLKELGVKQESLFYWADDDIVISQDIDLLLENGDVRNNSYTCNHLTDNKTDEIYSAFTSAELGEMLPREIAFNGDAHYLHIMHGTTPGYWHGCYKSFDHPFERARICDLISPVSKQGDSLANLIALMVIDLIEYNFMEVPK